MKKTTRIILKLVMPAIGLFALAMMPSSYASAQEVTASANGQASFVAHGEARSIDFSIRTATTTCAANGSTVLGCQGTGTVHYSDKLGNSYTVDVKYATGEGKDAWFAGRVSAASNKDWVGDWLFSKVTDNANPGAGRDVISGVFTSEYSASYRIATRGQTGENPYVIASGDVRVAASSRAAAAATSTLRASTTTAVDGLVGHWKLDDGSGTIVADSTGFGNGGTVSSSGALWMTGRNGGNALSFDGSKGFIAIDNAPNLQNATGTISVWMKTTDTGNGARTIFAKKDAFALYLQGNMLSVFDWGNFTERSTPVNLADNRWHNIIVTFEDGVIGGTSVYLDGDEKLTTTTSVLGHDGGLRIGNLGRGQYFKGAIDDVRLYDKILTRAEITALAGTSTDQ